MTISVGNLAEKYGKGKKSTMKCKTCSYEQDIFSSGVHKSEGGAIMVYDRNEEFSCPNCGLDGDIIEIDEHDDSAGPTTGIDLRVSQKNLNRHKLIKYAL